MNYQKELLLRHVMITSKEMICNGLASQVLGELLQLFDVSRDLRLDYRSHGFSAQLIGAELERPHYSRTAVSFCGGLRLIHSTIHSIMSTLSSNLN